MILIPCNIINVDTEVYPSPAEGIGLENRQGSQIPRGFESLYLLHNLLITTAHKLDIDEFRYSYVTGFLFSNILKNHRITGGFSVLHISQQLGLLHIFGNPFYKRFDTCFILHKIIFVYI